MQEVLAEVKPASRRLQIALISLAFTLLSAMVIAVFTLLTSPLNAVGYSLAFASGVSMIFLPCTLPLVLIVVPLSVSGGARKGLLAAASFGMGVTISLLVFGVFTASLGGYFGLNQSNRAIFIVAGIIAYAFALHMMGLLKLSLPTRPRLPGSTRRGGRLYFFAPFVFGLLLGDAGIGCPNPSFYILLAYIASAGDLAQGAILGTVHGFGRAVPLILISVLALLGTNLAKPLARNIGRLYAGTGVAMLFIGSWILVVGVFGDFFELLVFHDWWDAIIMATLGPKFAEHSIEFLHQGTLGYGWQYSPWILLAIFAVPVALWSQRKRLSNLRLPEIRGSTLLKLGVLAVLAASLVYYVGNAPPAYASFEELERLGFPFKSQGALEGIDLVAEPAEGEAPLTVEVKLVPWFGIMRNVGVQYWDWGDGFVSGSGGTRHHYTYTEPGIYEITATVYAGGGCGIATAIYEKTATVIVR